MEKQSLSIGAAFCLSGLVLVFDLRYILKGRETQTYTSLPPSSDPVLFTVERKGLFLLDRCLHKCAVKGGEARKAEGKENFVSFPRAPVRETSFALEPAKMRSYSY